MVRLLKTLKVEHFFEMIRNVENGQFLQAVKFNDIGNFFSKPCCSKTNGGNGMKPKSYVA